jgi:uncharacterized protein DUF1963
MEGASSRRGFLRALLRESARTAQEASSVLGAPKLPLPKPAAPSPPAPARRGPVLERARAAARTVTLEELLELATQTGLDARHEELRSLARHSVRLTSPTLDDHPAGAWLYEPSAGVLDDTAWPAWEGERLTLVAQLDLTDPALRDVDLPLPADGRLLFLYAAGRAPAGDLAAHAGAGRVLHVPATGVPAPAARLSVEMTIPRVWAGPVQRLGLDAIEHDGYLKLRRRIATLQDVELEDGLGSAVAYHRVLGYPNETTGLMPLMCELTSAGYDADELDGVAEDFGENAGRWRLLAQLTVDEEGPWTLGGRGGRLYFWIDGDALRAHDFTQVRTVAQPG